MIDKESQERILAEYDEKIITYKHLVERLATLLEQIFQARGIVIHSITGREKKRKSLAGKINKDDVTYSALSDVHDVAGIRIITYFSEDVEIITKVIEEEFNIIDSGNKREILEDNMFGYLSWHQIITLNNNRADLSENQSFRGLKVEIQTRSVLQHAWAEIEHDLGYKSPVRIPPQFKRRFALLSGQLESADNEFVRLRSELKEYLQNLPIEIKNTPDDVLLSYDAAFLFIDSPVVKEIDEEIFRKTDKPSNPRLPKMAGHNLEATLMYLRPFGIETVSDLSNALHKNKELILFFAEKINGKTVIKAEEHNYGPGISLRMLWYVLAAIARDSFIDNMIANRFRNDAENLALLIDEILKHRLV